ncbi:flagellar assembly protein FliW [Hydrogenimonas sp.]
MDFKATLPILGFESCKEVTLESIDGQFYRLMDKEGKASPAFTLVTPSLLRSDYVFDLPDSVVKHLQAERPEDLEVLNIMIIDTPIENSHINFLAPLLFNRKKGLMGQVVLDSYKYPEFGIADPIKNYLNHKEDAS